MPREQYDDAPFGEEQPIVDYQEQRYDAYYAEESDPYDGIYDDYMCGE